MSVISNNILAGAAGQAGGAAAGYEIERSLRFNSADSAYLNRTPSSAGNRKTWTWSGWVKKAGLGTQSFLFASLPANLDNYVQIYFSSDQLIINTKTSGNTATSTKTAGLFRDPSAWFHVVVAIDTTATGNSGKDRLKVYINGSLLEDSDYSTDGRASIALNSDLRINSTVSHAIGKQGEYSNTFANIYLADVHFIDGQALAASDFGEYDDNGVWQPKAYVASGPNNGTTWSSGGSDSDLAQGSWANVFNGASSGVHNDYSTVASEQGSGNSATLTFSPAISGVIEVVMSAAATGGSINGSVSLSDGSSITTTTYATSPKLESFGSKTNITSLTLNAGSNGGICVSEIRLDGVPLIDGNTTNIGVNGFHLDFSNNSSNAALGTDSSGNSNTWTVNNISVAAGAGNDSLFDSPTNGTQTDTGLGGEVSGNYCVFNPTIPTTHTLADGNLTAGFASGTGNLLTGTLGVSSGKWYWEFTINSGTLAMIGIADFDADQNSQRFNGNGGLYYYQSGGTLYGGLGKTSIVSSESYGSSYTSGDVIGVALDMDSNPTTLAFYKNNTSQGTATNATMAGKIVGPSYTNGGGATNISANFGQRPFAYAAPSGYKALCTTNLDDPTIADGSDYMDVVTYMGDNTFPRSISDLGFSPDFVWTKIRSQTYRHMLFDTVRGTGKNLTSSSTASETTNDDYGYISAFNSDGWTIAEGDISGENFNANTETYVAWTWDAGTSTGTNTDGTITSTVRANPSAGFSIVSYTGNGNNYPTGATVGHGLNVAPQMVIVKSRGSASTNWAVWHTKLSGADYTLLLNDTGAQASGSNSFNQTLPTSSVFSVGQASGGTRTNENNVSHVAYCFAPVEGYSAFGSYVGNGSATDGPFIYTGFRPAYLLLKSVDVTGGWALIDSARDPINAADELLQADKSAAEATSSVHVVDMLSNGFKLRGTGGSDPAINPSSTVLYAAFAENPFKYARAR